jgi:hypothetical protein
MPLIPMMEKAISHIAEGRQNEGEELLKTILEDYRKVARDPGAQQLGKMLSFYEAWGRNAAAPRSKKMEDTYSMSKALSELSWLRKQVCRS